jgi:hypothetical protein
MITSRNQQDIAWSLYHKACKWVISTRGTCFNVYPNEKYASISGLKIKTYQGNPWSDNITTRFKKSMENKEDIHQLKTNSFFLSVQLQHKMQHDQPWLQLVNTVNTFNAAIWELYTKILICTRIIDQLFQGENEEKIIAGEELSWIICSKEEYNSCL